MKRGISPPSNSSYSDTDFDSSGEENFNVNEATPMEGEVIDQRVKETNAKSLAATKNMVAMMDESRAAAYRTNANLRRQGEKMKGVERDLDDQAEMMDEAERDLDEMDDSGCCGCCCPGRCKRRRKRKRGSTIAANKKKRKVQYHAVRNENGEERNRANSANFRYVTKDAQEEQMADNLEMVDAMLDEIDLLADEMNTEIKDQNNRLERVEDKAKANQKQMTRMNAKSDKIIKGANVKKEEGGLAGEAMGI